MLLISTLRRGNIEASAHRLCRSAPEYPFVRVAASTMSSSVKWNPTSWEILRNNSSLPSLLGRGMYNLLTNLLLTASSSSEGLLVAPMTRILSLGLDLAPSSCTRNSVLIFLDDSCYPSEREHNRESISSIKMTLGCFTSATVKRVLTSFSPSPTHLLVSELALMLKKVDLDSLAMALPIRVFPVPGGPKRRTPFGGALSPTKMSGRSMGHTIIS